MKTLNFTKSQDELLLAGLRALLQDKDIEVETSKMNDYIKDRHEYEVHEGFPKYDKIIRGKVSYIHNDRHEDEAGNPIYMIAVDFRDVEFGWKPIGEEVTEDTEFLFLDTINIQISPIKDENSGIIEWIPEIPFSVVEY